MRLTEAKEIDENVSKWILSGENDLIKDYFEKNPEHIGNRFRLKYDQDLVMFAVYADNKEIFDWLLANGAKALANKKGFTPLHQATYSEDPYYVNELIKFGLKVDRGNTKTPPPLIFMVNELAKAQDGTGRKLSKSARNIKSEKLVKTFKALIDNGADVQAIDLNGNPLISNIVMFGFTAFFKEMFYKDSSLINVRMGGMDLLQLAMSNFNNDIVELLFDSNLELDFSASKRFITSTDDTDMAMKVYDKLDEISQRLLSIETMMHVQNGKDKMIRLLERGVKITDRFVLVPSIRKIADELLETNRADELYTLGLENEIEEFYHPDVKEMFMF